VNSGLSGVFAALVAVAFDAPGPLVGVVAVACGLAFLGISLMLVVRQYQRMQRKYVALFPTPDSSRSTRPLGEIAARLMLRNITHPIHQLPRSSVRRQGRTSDISPVGVGSTAARLGRFDSEDYGAAVSPRSSNNVLEV